MRMHILLCTYLCRIVVQRRRRILTTAHWVDVTRYRSYTYVAISYNIL